MPKLKKRADGRYSRQVYLGLGEDGRRQYKTVYGASPKEVDDKVSELRIQLKKGIDLSAKNEKFKEWSAMWLASKKGNVSAVYYSGLEGKVSALNDALGDYPIGKIIPADIQSFINAIAEKNPHTNRPSAKKTLRDFKGIVEQIFCLAIENRVVDFNPAQYVRIPARAPKETRRALTEEEQQWIVDTPHRAQRAAMIMMYAGLRRGEVIPLQWKDIDLSNGTIHVAKSVEMVNGKAHQKSGGKTLSSERVVDIPNRLIAFLQKEKGKASPLELVCPAANGGMMGETAFRRMWESYLTDLNFKYGNRMDTTGKPAKSKCNPNGIPRTIPPITAHWLRHTFATMLYLSGIDVLTARDQLGHSDIKTTLDIYTHLDRKYKRRSMSKLNDYLDPISTEEKSAK